MTSLDISSNMLACGKFVGGHGYYPGRGHKDEKDNPENYASDTSGVQALADAIRNNGALTSLNLANNSIKAKGAKHVAAALAGCK